jgi:hypothetical protein
MKYEILILHMSAACPARTIFLYLIAQLISWNTLHIENLMFIRFSQAPFSSLRRT